MTKKFGAEIQSAQLPETLARLRDQTPRLDLDECYSRMSGPPTVMWDVTNTCNLVCLHCYNRSGTSPPVEDLDTATTLDVADQIREMRPFVVCMCGGEPLMRQDLELVVERLKLDVPHVNTVTNGWLMTRERLARLKAAGVGSIQVSLDGASALTHDNSRGKPESWERAVATIRLLVSEGFRPPVTLIPHRLNYPEIEEWAELCLELGAYNLRLMPLIPIGRARENRDLIELNGSERLEVQAALRRVRARHPEADIEWGDPMEHIYNFSSRESRMRSYSVEIRSDGKLAVSTYLPLVVGDLRRHRLREYWEAGLSDVWRHPRVAEWTRELRALGDFSAQEPQPWSGEDVEFDLIDGEPPPIPRPDTVAPDARL